MERIERIGPEVVSKWELPNIAEQTSTAGPVEAFRLFMAYAERALDHDLERELNNALKWDAIVAGEIRRIVPEAVEGSALVGQPYLHTPKEVEERITQEVSTALRGRIAPLLPAIHTYVSNRPNDPATVTRLGWMAAQIEAIPGALEGRALWRSREQPEGYFWHRKFEPMAWKGLHDGLLEMLNTPTVDTSSAPVVRTKYRSHLEDPPPTFRDLLGEDNLARTLAAIEELGYRPTAAKGKGHIIAAMEAALEKFEVKSPLAKHWPHMLNKQFDGIRAGTKAYPPTKAAQRTKSYKDARAAMLDRLNR